MKETARDLGMQISTDLIWHTHSIETTRKANSVANAILHLWVKVIIRPDRP